MGYRFPAEWEPHKATWLSWPHNVNSWPGKIDTIYPAYGEFVKIVAKGEQVNININNEGMRIQASGLLEQAGVDMERVTFFEHPTNDAWCRDHGPAFVINPGHHHPKAILAWRYNAWGEKYPPFDLDDAIPGSVAEALGVPAFYPGIVMEGGAVDFNGYGDVLTTTACLLHENRNPTLSQADIEQYIYQYYGATQVLWLNDGIIGDDTDGHIDDIARFVNKNTLLMAIEDDQGSPNFKPLKENFELASQMATADGTALDLVEIPMPKPVIYEGRQLPASYANFYISNAAVVVPTFRDDTNDQKALDIIAKCFPDRKVVGIDSVDLIWGLGSFHCLSQQEPLI